jgi:hypothetical protein
VIAELGATRPRREGRDAGRSVRSYFDAFAPAPVWDDLVRWPPDVFALANLVLDHTEAYRFAVAPPAGRRWPPEGGWDAEVRANSRSWREGSEGVDRLPPLVSSAWETVTRYRDVPLARVRSGEAWDLVTALLGLHALADEACAEVGAGGRRGREGSLEQRAWAQLQSQGSLSRLSPTRVRVVPKTHFSGRGITIRSLSRYLALCYESVEVRWRSVEPGPSADRDDYTIVLVPWPLSVGARHFRPVPSDLLANLDTSRFGFFEFTPEDAPDEEQLGKLLEAAVNATGRVDAVVLPEGAVAPEAIAALERTLARHDATFLISGVLSPPTASGFGRNYLHFGVRAATGWRRYEQDKHHRWCLDRSQILQYHLSRSLPPSRLWWEAIDVRERTLHVIDVGGGVTAAPLVCEDLARLDEVADLLRRIGPSLVVALLLDGPQLATRWPCRYASVIADDPGSAVLTLTSYGMATRSRPRGASRSRVVAHWTSRRDGVRELELERGAAAILLSTAVERTSLWTADGRRHEHVPCLRLAGVQQLRV